MKLKPKTKKAIRGSITILLVIILLPMMTFSAVIVDMSRVNMAKSMVSGAGDLTMNTALANYDTILKDVYGLFAMSQEKTETELAADLRTYFAKTIASYGVVEEAEAGEYVDSLIGDFSEIINDAKNNTDNFLEMDVSADTMTFNVDLVDQSALSNPGIMRKQIVEYMKYRAPMTFGLSFIDALKSFQSVEEQNKVVEAQVTAQESTQDVTKNCQKLIKLIREFDDLVKSVENGDRTVKGSANHSDGVAIPIWPNDTDLSPYSTQLDKYRSAWGLDYNYQYINKINLVFLANSPSADSVYLKNLKYPNEIYIKQNGAGLIYDKSGITVNPSLKGDTAGAKQQVFDQINALASQDALETTYKNQNFLDTSNLNSQYTNFASGKEESAINTFIAFEKFLLDQNSTVKYSSVKSALEQITVLGKYYDNYYKLISADITRAEGELNTAKTNTTNAQKAMNGPSGSINTAAQNIYNTASSFYASISEEEEPLSCLDGTGMKDKVLSLLQRSKVNLPGGSSYGTNLVPSYTIRNFNGFYGNFKESAGEADDIYLKYFKSIVNSLKGSNSVAKSASDFLSSGGDFTSYMKKAEGGGVTGNELFKVLNCLYSCSKEAQKIPGLIDTYNAATPGYADLVSAQHQKQEVYNSLVAERSNVTSKYNLELNEHRAFVTAYQADAFYYGKYVETAKNIVTEKASKINTQIVALRDNVKALVDKLGKIQSQITATKTAITTYDNNVDKWEKANNSYVTSNESDSFSDQSAADIKNARSQYNEESFKNLSDYVDSMKVYYETFYKYITDTTHFKYGTTKIDTITKADQVISAVSGIKSSLSSVVTVEEANQKYASLYSSDKTPLLQTVGQMCYLEPTVVQIQILKYLNSAFPDQETQTEAQKGEETSYKDSVKSLANGTGSSSSGGAVEKSETNNSGKYGYTYTKASISGDLPSKDSTKKTVTTTEFDMNVSDTEDGGLDVDTSSGTTAQKNVLSTVLSGIGNAVKAGVENLYILTYLFENFSYNTIVQDEVADNYKFDTSMTPSAQLVALETHLATAENWKAYDGKIKTLSNYPITAKNNYIYGAELEYILYGNTTAKTNVTYAKASIYAIRFGFNCIYAFTNSEIRNTTMSAGLAVQAATLGIVPYQLVQIVLQLALAAAEAAIDLEMMNCGLDVAIVKTTDSWSLSISNLSKSAANLATSVANAAVDKAITGAVDLVTNGIQGIVDATTDELSGAINDVTTNLTTATQKVIQDAVDQAFSHVTAKVEEGINSLQYLEANDKASIKAEVSTIFTGIKNNLSTELNAMFAGNELAMKAINTIVAGANSLVSSVEKKVNDTIDTIPTESDISEALIAEITSIKQYMIGQATNAVNGVMGGVNSIVQGAVAEVEGTLQGYADQAKNLTEEKAEELKKQVQETTNGYINKYLDNGNSNAIGGSTASSSGSSSNSIASMMKFGYKEYLMLFMFLGLCVESSSNAILKRTADVIQLNVQHLGEGSSYKHDKGAKFLMKNAYTYVSVDASVELEMFFMNLDFFTKMLSDEETEVEGDLTKFATIKYKGVLGY